MNNTVMGLTSAAAQKRLVQDGENRLAQSKAVHPAGIFAGQFKDAMVIILLAATAVSTAMGEYLDSDLTVGSRADKSFRQTRHTPLL